MPIKGLTEKRRLPRIGKLRMGIMKVADNGKSYPSATEYFVVPPEVQKVFGEQPKELKILIPVEDEEKWCSQYYRAYSLTRGLVCKGDGETAMRMIDKATGAIVDHTSKEIEMREVKCLGRECEEYNKPGNKKPCKEIMNLQFLLPDVPGLGVWQIDTGSINGIMNINNAAAFIKSIYGRISMIPLLLTIEPREIQRPDGKKNTVQVMHLRTNQTLLQMVETSLKPTQEMLTSGLNELPEPDDEVPEMIIPQNQESFIEGVVVDNKPEPEPVKQQVIPVTEPPKEKALYQTNNNDQLTLFVSWLKQSGITMPTACKAHSVKDTPGLYKLFQSGLTCQQAIDKTQAFINKK